MIDQAPLAPLDEAGLAKAVRALSRRDPDLARVRRRFGSPPLWAREPGFATLLRIILEQQVSLASANAAYGRLRDALGAVTPGAFLGLDDAQLKAVGFSRQKTRYGRELARAVIDRSLDLEAVRAMGDDDARAALVRVTGIGHWTADVYLLMALGRPDVLPRGDVALLTALCDIKRLTRRPTHDEFAEMADAWRPHRSAAARLLWHHYLSTRRILA